MKEKREQLSSHLGNKNFVSGICWASKYLPCGKETSNFVDHLQRKSEEGLKCRDPAPPICSPNTEKWSESGEWRHCWNAETQTPPGNMMTLRFGSGLAQLWGSRPVQWTHTYPSPPPYGMEVTVLNCLLWGKRAMYTEEVCPTEQLGTSCQRLKRLCLPTFVFPLSLLWCQVCVRGGVDGRYLYIWI